MKLLECKNCKTLKDEIDFLRTQNKSLLDRLMALTDVQAYQAVERRDLNPNDDLYYGDDEETVVNDYGQLVNRKLVEPENA